MAIITATPLISPVTQSYLDYLVSLRVAEHERVKEFRRFDVGDHPDTLSKDEKDILNFEEGYKYNVCPLIIGAKVDRLLVRGIIVADPADATSDAQSEDETSSARLTKLVRKWWDDSDMDSGSNDLHYNTLRDADGYLMTSYDKENMRPHMSVNMAYDGDVGVEVVYDDRGTATRATKRWTLPSEGNSDRVRRRTDYYPDRVIKMISAGSVKENSKYPEGQWVAFDEEDTDELKAQADYEPGVLWWTDDGTSTGVPLGLAVIPFKNGGQLHGRSDLADVVPEKQVALNIAGVSLVAASRLAGFPVNWISGDNVPDTLRVYPAALLSFSENTSAGQFPAAQLGQLIEAKNSEMRDIATITSTPLSYFNSTGQIAAAATLQQQEAPLLAKVERCQQSFGNSYENAALMMLKLEVVFGEQLAAYDLEQLDTFTISTKWNPPETRNSLAEAQEGLLMIQAGIPEEIVWEEQFDLTPEQIERAKRINEDRRRVAAAQFAKDLRIPEVAGNGTAPAAVATT